MPSPLNFDTLTPPPERARQTTRKVILWILAIGVVLTAGRWYYDEQVLPSRPLAWHDGGINEIEQALEKRRAVIIFVEGDDEDANLDALDQIETRRCRKLIRRNQLRTLRIRIDPKDEEHLALVDNWELTALPCLVVAVPIDKRNGSSASSVDVDMQHDVFSGESLNDDSIYPLLYELRYGRPPRKKTNPTPDGTES